MTRFACLLLLMWCAASCGADVVGDDDPWNLGEGPPTEEPEPEPQPEPEPERDLHARFQGRWIVHDNIPRGGITADVFDFEPDGTLTLIERYDSASFVVTCEPGSQECLWAEGTVRCDFGATWSSQGPERLFIQGECNDGVPREIAFTFPADATTNASFPGTTVTLFSVGGEETGWATGGFLGPLDALHFERCGPDVFPCMLP